MKLEKLTPSPPKKLENTQKISRNTHYVVRRSVFFFSKAAACQSHDRGLLIFFEHKLWTPSFQKARASASFFGFALKPLEKEKKHSGKIYTKLVPKMIFSPEKQNQVLVFFWRTFLFSKCDKLILAMDPAVWVFISAWGTHEKHRFSLPKNLVLEVKTCVFHGFWCQWCDLKTSNTPWIPLLSLAWQSLYIRRLPRVHRLGGEKRVAAGHCCFS